MAYSDFTLNQLQDNFQLNIEEATDLFSTIQPITICDYIITLSKQQLYISAPVITIVEAKNDNIKSGLAQCAAAMLAAKLFNSRK